ncbi:coenzyme F420-0:L-glutamate ligase [Candidatus Kaiserbacteria bacterium]|nr:coenzyme F420-0:L-glutamate ligase [Candidatus Kaiserbacteria bacterium]
MSTQSVEKIFKPNGSRTLEIDSSRGIYLRLPIKTGLITEKDDLMAALEKYVRPHLEPGDILFISEKIVALTQGRIIPYRNIKVTPLARLLARKVENKLHTKEFKGFGHGTAMGMQLLIEEAGYLRAIFAAAVAAITKPLGIRGAFYYLVGKQAKSVDCPMSFSIHPYLHYAKLAPIKPWKVAKEIKERFGNDVVIIDANYRGSFTLGIAGSGVTEKFAQELFRDNPSGQSEEFTPFILARRA